MSAQATLETENVRHKAGQYLTFMLADEQYGLEILKVIEIVGMMEITAVPRMPPFVKGVANLRGKVVPVVDLRLKFDMPESGPTESRCIIVVSIGEAEIGIIVDNVSEVLEMSADEIEETPSFGVDVDTRFILGMGKAGGRITILLEIDKLLTEQDVIALVDAESGSAGA
jgi:purine-binding chemotaxis protein CheW